MLDAITASKIAIYINNNKKTIAQVKAETGCSHIINGGLFDRDEFKPVCHLKSNDVVYSTEDWTRWGFGFNNTDKFFTWSKNMSQYDNYIDCVELVKDGQLMSLTNDDGTKTYPSDMAYACDRTAIGFNDGTVLLYCSQDDDTPETLQTKLYNLGWKNALLLDGGGSSECITNTDIVTTSRIVYDFICVWDQTVVTTLYTVQLGAFSSQQNALTLCNKIKLLPDTINAGYANAYVKLIEGLYKVQVGVFSHKGNAQKVIDDLKSKGYSAFITIK